MKHAMPYLPYVLIVFGILAIAIRKSIRKRVADRLQERGIPIMLVAMTGQISRHEADRKLLALARGGMWIFTLNTFMLWGGLVSITAGAALLFGVINIPIS